MYQHTLELVTAVLYQRFQQLYKLLSIVAFQDQSTYNKSTVLVMGIPMFEFLSNGS
jgi:hypothetical protein